MSLPPELIWLVRSRNGRFVATFAGFVVIQFIFAALCYWLYKRSRDNFNFNSDILKEPGRRHSNLDERSLANLRAAIRALGDSMTELDRGARSIVNGKSDASLDLLSGHRCVMVFMTGPP